MRALLLLSTALVGFLAGGYIFSRSIPRSFLAAPNCEQRCYKPSDLAGLVASIGIQSTSAIIPSIGESDQCIAIQHPKPEGRVHIVLFPKRDVRNVLEIQPEDGPFVLGCFALARELVKRSDIANYRIYTNGPALQHVTYLHFHLVAK